MDPRNVAKQMLKFNKIAFDSTFDTMTIIQEQIEKTINRFLEQNVWMPAEGKNAIGNWVQAYKKGRNDYKTAMDNNFKMVEDFFVGQDKT